MAAVLNILFFVFLASPVISTRTQFFRKDYTYYEEYDAFYKVHLDAENFSWSKAFMTCEDEGAKLFYPKAAGEWTVVKNLLALTNRTVVFAIIGLHDEFGMNDFVSDDGKPAQLQINSLNDGHEAQCVLMNIDSGAYIAESCARTSERSLAFVCKKIDDQSCPTIDRGYKYNAAANMCYKVNNKARSWAEAWRTCIMEGGSLAVVRNGAQATALIQLIHNSPDNDYYVGFRKMTPFNVFYSVLGNSIDDEYPLIWYGEHHENCGMLYYQNSQLYRRTTNCAAKEEFICEMELGSISYASA